MRVSFTCLAALVALSSACTSEPFDLRFELRGESAILVVRASDRIDVYAVEDEAQRVSLPDVLSVEVFALDYPSKLEAYGLSAGPIEVAREGELGVLLPRPERIRGRRFEERFLSEEEELREFPAALANLKIRTLSVEACLDGGGCFMARPVDGVQVCMSDCPTPSAPESPDAPEAPVMTPCPTGWIEVPAENDEDVAECAPWIAAVECPAGSTQLPGEEICHAVGGACPDGMFREPPADADVVFYVDADAPAGGDGTEASPWPSMDSIPVGGNRGTVAVMLASGVYGYRGGLGARTVIVGACPVRTRLNGVGGDEGEIALRNLSLSSVYLRGGRLELAGVVVYGGASGVAVIGTELLAEDVHVVLAATSSVAFEVLGGQATIRRLRAEGGGVSAADGANVRVEDSVILRARNGLVARRGGQLVAHRTAIFQARVNSLLARDRDSILDVEDVYCVGGWARAWVEYGARLSGRRLSIQGGQRLGVLVQKADIDVADLLIRDIGASVDPRRREAAVYIISSAQARLQRVLVADVTGAGVYGIGKDVFAELVDTRIIEVASDVDMGGLHYGYGVYLGENAVAQVKRMEVRRAHGLGLGVRFGAALSGTDLAVVDTLPRDRDGAYGRGMELTGASVTVLDRLSVRRSRNIAIYAEEAGTEFRVKDLLVSDTQVSNCVGYSCLSGNGDGLYVAFSASVEVERFLVERCVGSGVQLVNGGSWMSLRDGQISNNEIGAEVTVSEGYAVERLAEGVRYIDNVLNLVER